MITLEDRLHDTGDDLRQAATRVPARGMPAARRAVPPRAKWAAAALAVAALAALPIWLGAFDAPGQDPPLGGGAASDLGIILRLEADAIAFLDDSVITPSDALILVEEIRQWEGVAKVGYVSRELALIEYRELFADQPSMVALVESDPSILPPSIRLLLVDGADANEIGARLRLIPGVIRVSPGGEPDKGSSLLGLGGRPFTDASVIAAFPVPPLPGTVVEVASREQAGIGTLIFLAYEIDADAMEPPIGEGLPPGGTIAPAHSRMMCLTTVIVDAGMVADAGTGCGSESILATTGVTSSGECSDHQRRFLVAYGLDPSRSGNYGDSALITFDDGTTAEVTVVNGTVLIGWEGPTRITNITVDDLPREVQGLLSAAMPAGPICDPAPELQPPDRTETGADGGG